MVLSHISRFAPEMFQEAERVVFSTLVAILEVIGKAELFSTFANLGFANGVNKLDSGGECLDALYEANKETLDPLFQKLKSVNEMVEDLLNEPEVLLELETEDGMRLNIVRA